MARKKSSGLYLDPSTGELKPVTRSQKIQQWIYGFTEPMILRFTDFMLATPERARQFNKTPTPKALPREVVVTAEFGMKRVARSIGSSVQNVKSTDILESGRESFTSALQGRVAGVIITNNSGNQNRAMPGARKFLTPGSTLYHSLNSGEWSPMP